MSDVAQMRRSYELGDLREQDAGEEPIAIFRSWFEEVRAEGEVEANAMTLSTVDASSRPRSRVVLLKELRDDGAFIFFTNYESAKGREISSNPNVALNFLWLLAERQVRVEGVAQRLSREASAEYFHQRPRASQLGAWASAQSQAVESREALEARYRECEARFGDGEIPCPDFWGGYAVIPSAIEFWQGRVGRLHDRLCYERAGDGWSLRRLMP